MKRIFARMNLDTTRQTLISSSTELFLKYGVKSVSMDDIARLLGISKKTIYNFISNKKGLVQAVVQAQVDLHHKEVNEIMNHSTNALSEMVSIAENVLAMLKRMKPSLTYDLKKYHPNAWKIIEEVHFKFIQTSITKNLNRGIKEGLYRAEIDTALLSKLYLILSRSVTEDDSLVEEGHAISDVFATVIHYHLNGIVSPKGKKELKKYLKF